MTRRRWPRKSHELGARILQLETEAYEDCRPAFNLSSPKQLGEIFFDKLGMPVIKDRHRCPQHRRRSAGKTGRGLPLPAKLLEHRSLVKLKGTYTDKARPTGPATHRPRAHALRAGRGCHGPLVQQRPQPANIPIRTPKAAACARPVALGGRVIASADYSRSSCASWPT